MKFCLETYLKELEYLVNTDSATRCPGGTAKIAAFFAEKFEALGWHVTYHRLHDEVGPCLEICNKISDHYDILCLGHMDTALPIGAPEKRPFSIDEDGIAHGPGVGDMKSCLLSMYYTLADLQTEGHLDHAAVCLSLNSDEEISSIYSRPLLEKLAKKSSYSVVIESARKDGSLVNQRRGVGRYTLKASGVAAHSGVNPQDGSSAIHELANWIVELHKLNDLEHGTSVNVGVIRGGVGPNTVAAEAEGLMDLRFSDEKVPEILENKMKEMQQNPFTKGGAKIEVLGGVTRPPMNPTADTLSLCDEIVKLSERIQVPIHWTSTGGGADGSFTAMHGVPTIDGVGPVAGNAHSEREYMVVDSIEPRYRLSKEIIRHILQRKAKA